MIAIEELFPADFVFVQGRKFDGGSITAELVDPSDPLAVLPTPIAVDVKPNSIRFTIPSFSTSRKRYELRIRKDGKLAVLRAPQSDDLFLRSFGSTAPGQKIHLQHIGWGESVFFLFELSAWFNFPPPYTNSGDDRWEGDWAILRPIHDQSGRDWAAICGAAWNQGASRIVNDVAEELPRESLTWNFYTRMDVTEGNAFLDALGNGQMLWDPDDTTQLTGHLAGQSFTPCQTETDPVACSKFVGERPNTVVMHHVTKMFRDGLELDPATEERARQPVSFPGILIVSSNPCLGCRPDPPIGQPGVVWPPDSGAPKWADDPLRPPTPNLFAHELVHVAGFLVDEERGSVVQVSDPDQFTRGYALDSQAPNPVATHGQNCDVVLDGIGGVDYTR